MANALVHDGRAVTALDRATERALRETVREKVGRLLDERQLLTPRPDDEARIRALIHEEVEAHQRRVVATNQPLLADPAGVERRIFDGLLRLGPLQPLMDDPAVEEVIVNGPRVFRVRDGHKELVADVFFEDDEELRQVVKRLVGPLGRRLDESSPMVDARLPDGSRLNAAIPPATTRWTSVTIRKFVLRASRLEQLVQLGTLTAAAARFLDAAVQAGVNILVSGATASGKCVAGDTPVTLADGRLVPIRELVDAAFAIHPPAVGADGWASASMPSPVLTCDFARRTLRPASGVTAWRHPAPSVLVEVRTRSGQMVRGTPEHPFFKVVDGEVVQVRADQLRVNDGVAVAAAVPTGGVVPRTLDLLARADRLYVTGVASFVREALARVRAQQQLTTLKATYGALGLPWRSGQFWRSVNPVPASALLALLGSAGLPVDELGRVLILAARRSRKRVAVPAAPTPALARLAGLVVGDGHLGRATVELTSGDPNVRRSFAGLVKEVFGLDVGLRPGAYRCPTLVLNSVVVAEFLSAAFAIPRGAKACSVRVPAWLFAAPVEHIASYLSGLLDTDGSVARPSDEGTPRVEFVTSSSCLAEDVVALLLRLGVRSHLRRRAGCDRVTVYEPSGLLRLRDLLPLAHTKRRAVLGSCQVGCGHSNVDLVPGLAVTFRDARLAVGLSHVEVAAVYGISRSLSGLYEQGARHPTRRRALEIARRTTDRVLAARLLGLASQPIFWDRVASVRHLEHHGEEYVYDLTVPSDVQHTYGHSSLPFAGGFPIRLTVEYAAEYRVDGDGPFGLPAVRRTYEAGHRVQEIQTVLVAR